MPGTPSSPVLPTSSIVIHQNSELAKLRALVGAARARLAELEAAYTIEKVKVDGLQARLFSRLRQYHQERERLRLVVSYRMQFLGVLLQRGEEEAEQVRREYHEAKARSDREYEETAAAMAAKKKLTADEEAELGKLWKALVKLFTPIVSQTNRKSCRLTVN